MIRTLVITRDFELLKGVTLEELSDMDCLWYWIDFDRPTEEEILKLRNPLRFHPLAIEDCIHKLQRPKLDYYEDHTFFVLHSLHPEELIKEEINIFLGTNFIVTFHQHLAKEIHDVWSLFIESDSYENWDPYLILYQLMDKIVDNYFPLIYKLEDRLNEIEDNSKNETMEVLLESLFDTRHELLSMRHTVTPMSDLLYRMLNSHRLDGIQRRAAYFTDIHDHLLKLTGMIDANRELTADIRDSYLSLNAHQTNRVMKVLTVITTIFMPLTLIAGIYGMNFDYMPELHWNLGYFIILILMFIIGAGMSLWFMKKGWFK
ncbi:MULTISPECIES: magnesium/cobalt transporter CorA [Heyndrickxia]|uniref:magnesium/cobalt transporter CorA n=1 Tax=Heyndrickxia TaxID=2837504 RepID=UPI0015D3CFB0|nr:magnesium/cobalt transporter CorA [Heyndrickxia oleronia]NYV66731.1 magnesium/cobalt transporter CorA [Bacillus sp. Gen3]MBU5211895.1 magnesium/cobalt transporter CorA [Heyndrickxia oleronia]MCI1591301.1 magnesium/cobalt transporter CorA [Heyndrickxia oleronia]MCI1613662.1 magnesium/cobalt transporter CorA [Heyndrickxia oleronia]MCI1744792.1 magnesium/cobalt transporter CorA [Heyndrickxia oleronia]